MAKRRNARHFGNPTRDRPTKWCRQHFTDVIQDENNLVSTDMLVLCPITTAILDQADITAGNPIRIVGALNRAQPSTAEITCMWIVALQKFDFATGVFLQVVNPFDDNALSSHDIMGFGFLDVPPVVLTPSTDAVKINSQSIAFDITVGVARKLKRNTHSIALTFASKSVGNTDNVLAVELVTSVLLKWG